MIGKILCFFGFHDKYWDIESYDCLDFYLCRRCKDREPGAWRPNPAKIRKVEAEWDREIALAVAQEDNK